MTIDFEQVVIVNENADPDQAGAVTLFESIVDPQLKLSVVKGKGIFSTEKVRIEPDLSAQNHSNRIGSLLEATGTAVQGARKRRKGIEPGLNPAPMSIAELIELVGFSK